MSALKFEDQKFPQGVSLDDYARLAEQFVPGRHAMFKIIEAAFLEVLPPGPARFLIVGAGGGEEILRLGEKNPDWSFVGVDTYEPMLDLARKRLAGVPAGIRAKLQATPIGVLEDRGFDAATCLLTAHFVPDDGAKFAFLKAIHDRLRPGAPLAIIDGVGEAGEERTELLRRIWRRHAILNGVAPDVAELNAENFKKLAVVPEGRLEALLTSAGFTRLTPVFRAVAINGWLAFA